MIVPSARLGFEEGPWDTGDHGSDRSSSGSGCRAAWRPGRSRRRRPPAPLQGPSAASSGSTRSATRSARPSGLPHGRGPPPTRPGSRSWTPRPDRALGQGRAGGPAAGTTGTAPVHVIDFGALRAAGSYRSSSTGVAARLTAIPGRDPPRPVPTARRSTPSTSSRSSATVPHVPRRLTASRPHLTDRRATVYAHPGVRGRWRGRARGAARADRRAGGRRGRLVRRRRLRQVHPHDRLLGGRAAPRPAWPHPRSHALAAETRHGLRWLDKVWDERHRVLYAQVGLGTGSEGSASSATTTCGGCPRPTTRYGSRPGDADVLHQVPPGFRAAPPGEPVSPQPGRAVAAAVRARRPGGQAARRPQARPGHWLGAAASLFARPGPPTSASSSPRTRTPTIPRTPWPDDMEYGAVELALAGRMLRRPAGRGWLRDAGALGRRVPGLRAPRRAQPVRHERPRPRRAGPRAAAQPAGTGFEVTEDELVADLRRQLDAGVGRRRQRASATPSTLPSSTRPRAASASRPPPGCTGGDRRPHLRRVRHPPARLRPRRQRAGASR